MRPGRYKEASGTRQKRSRNREAVAMMYSFKYDGAEDYGVEDTGIDGNHVN